ncbi:MAG: hypothetical protein HZB67_01765 [Candidatus Aenigmarchaeota archaeon]|nr:hypothetical protein [Candidatus Aenigmarchaeota archaeon]
MANIELTDSREDPVFLREIEELTVGTDVCIIDSSPVTYRILRREFDPEDPYFAGDAGRLGSFLSEAFPKSFRYPVVVHEHTEYRTSGGNQNKAIKAEIEAAKATGILAAYLDFRIGHYNKSINSQRYFPETKAEMAKDREIFVRARESLGE